MGMASAIHGYSETAMVNVKCKSDCAVVPVNGIIEEEMMLELVSAIQQLHNDYFYTHIELEVCSPGGQAMALDYCVEAMDALRARGVRFTTQSPDVGVKRRGQPGVAGRCAGGRHAAPRSCTIRPVREGLSLSPPSRPGES